MHPKHLVSLALLALPAAMLSGSVLHARPATMAQDSPSWDHVWADLARLEVLAPDAQDAQPLHAALRERGASFTAGSASGKAQLLRARLEAWAGGVTEAERLALSRTAFQDWSVREKWLAAGVLLPGAVRAALVLGLLATQNELTREQQIIAWETGVAEAQALRLRSGALPIQESLHERYHAGWTGYDLGQTLRRLGEVDWIRDVLSELIEQEEAAGRSSAELWSTWGIATLGFGDESRARDYLGRALAGGSTDAALVLGKLDLDAGRMAAARMNFRPSVLTHEPSPWALRGWGMTLLPAVRTHPKGAELPAQHD